MEPTIEQDFDSIKIRFGGVLHAHITKSKLLGVQSWRYGPKKFSIEYVMVGGSILTEYDSEQKWKTILHELDKIL